MNSEINRYREHLQRMQINEAERQRKLRVWQENREMPVITAAPVAGFSVGVSNSTVKQATVVIGWVDGLTYTDKNGKEIVIYSEGFGDEKAIIRTSTTNNQGIANFQRFETQWKITDYSAGPDEPVDLYAPMYSLGGSQDAGYDPPLMTSNASTTFINPITTTVLSIESFASRKLEDIPVSKFENAVSKLEEFTGLTYSSAQKEKIRKGEADPEMYAPLVEPFKNLGAFLEGLTIEDTIVDVEIDPNSNKRVNVKRSSLLASELTGLNKFSDYFEDRENGKVDPTLFDKYNMLKETSDTLGNKLGYQVNGDQTKDDLIDLIYKKDLTVETVQSFVSDARDSGTLKKIVDVAPGPSGGGVIVDPGVPKTSVNILSIDPATTNVTIFTNEEIVPKGSTYTAVLDTIKANGSSKSYDVVLNLEAQSANLNLYSFSITSAIGQPTPDEGDVFIITVVLVNARTQKSNRIKFTGGNYVDEVSGRLLSNFGPIMPPKGPTGDPGETGPGGITGATGSPVFLAYINTGSGIENGPTANMFLLQESIAGQPVFKGFFNPGDGRYRTIWNYWNGEQWVLDDDSDPTEVQAYGPASSNPEGNYLLDPKDATSVIAKTVKIEGGK